MQAVENKNIIASDDFLSTLLETIKEGVLNCKIVSKDGKRSSDRSWRPAWAVLKKSGALFLCKEKKDNIMIPSVDSYPINLKSSVISVAYDYTKRKNVFKVSTFSNSEYLFQTFDYESMIEWIKAMQENSTPAELKQFFTESNSSAKHSDDQTSKETPSTNSLNSINSKYNQILAQQKLKSNRENWPLNSENKPQITLVNNLYNKPPSNDLMTASSPDELFPYNNNISPNHLRKSEDTSPRRDTNRKWVRQMTRKIRDFMTNNNSAEISNEHQHEVDINRNFGVALDKCESSSVSMVKSFSH